MADGLRKCICIVVTYYQDVSKQNISTRCGVRTHVSIQKPDLKSGALTTRPTWWCDVLTTLTMTPNTLTSNMLHTLDFSLFSALIFSNNTSRSFSRSFQPHLSDSEQHLFHWWHTSLPIESLSFCSYKTKRWFSITLVNFSKSFLPLFILFDKMAS